MGTLGRSGEELEVCTEGIGVSSGELEMPAAGSEAEGLQQGCRGLCQGNGESSVGSFRGGLEELLGSAAEQRRSAAPEGLPEGCPSRPPRRGALTCFPAAAARDFCRNCRSRGSDGAAETVPRARAMESRARAHWRRHDSISPAGRARGGGG